MMQFWHGIHTKAESTSWRKKISSRSLSSGAEKRSSVRAAHFWSGPAARLMQISMSECCRRVSYITHTVICIWINAMVRAKLRSAHGWTSVSTRSNRAGAHFGAPACNCVKISQNLPASHNFHFPAKNRRDNLSNWRNFIYESNRNCAPHRRPRSCRHP